jgi:YrbI family 3-deoxy-D-manno-octulosonate 8-phosphate phosphatase
MKNIRLIVTDIDGVLTNSTFLMDVGMHEWKKICYRDLDSIRLGRSNGFEFVFITAEKTEMSHAIGKRFGVDTIEGQKDKLSSLKRICDDRDVTPDQICYIGDSDRDAEAIKYVGLGVAPCDGTEEARENARYITDSRGGEGVLFEIVKMLIASSSTEKR